MIPVAFFGGGFWPTVLALVLGTGLGSLTHGILSSWGPKFGVPQLVQARGAIGFVGNFLPAGLNTFTAGVGWFIVNSVSGAFALQSLFGWQFWIGYVLVVVAQVGVAFVGHNFLSKTHFGAGFEPKYSPGGGSRRGRSTGGWFRRGHPGNDAAANDGRGSTMAALEDKLVEYIDDAYAMEQNVLRMLDGMIGTTKDPQMKRALERHRKQTEKQAERLEECLQEHGKSPSKVKAAGGMMGALVKSVLDAARDDSPGRNARDGFATEHMEIASYEMLERVARKAKDRKTQAVARQNREEEEAMARSIAAKWNKVVELSLKEEGVRT